MRLRDTVRRADVAEAVRLMKVATQSAATRSPRTGQIDMDLITRGRTALDREQGALASELRVVRGARGDAPARGSRLGARA